MQVTISAAAPFWSRQAALAAQQDGSLRYLVTGAPDHTQWGLDANHVRYVMPPAYVRYGLERVLPGVWGQHTAANVGNNLYDLLARRYATDCDVLHVYNDQGLWSMRRAARQGIKTIVERASAHILPQHRLLREEFERHGLRFPRAGWPMEWKHIQEYEEADQILVPSEFVRQTMLSEGIPPDKLTTVELGVNLDTFQPQPKQDDVFRVLFVGAVAFRKGLPYLLEAFAGLNLPNSELLLVGMLFPEMRRVLARYEGRYRFMQGVPHDTLRLLYSSASVVVMPSIEDGFGMAVAEAMACARPVIISDNTGISIEDSVEGFVVPIRSSAAIAEKLAYLYENPDACQRMGQAAHQRAKALTWDNYRSKVLDLYRRLTT